MGSTPSLPAKFLINVLEENMKKLCGLRPTGKLHIGHYFAVIEPAMHGADVLIATYHAPTEVTDVNSTLVRLWG